MVIGEEKEEVLPNTHIPDDYKSHPIPFTIPVTQKRARQTTLVACPALSLRLVRGLL